MGLLVSATTPKGNGFNYTQSTPSTSWVITHNLNIENGPAVDVSVNYNGSLQKIIPSSIVATSADVVTITFTTAYSGVARLV
jgi:hypothetical protein